jgi:hypothetical protein
VLKELKVATVLVFDVIETLLDLGSLREPFARAFSDATSLGEWFARAAPRLAGCDGDGRAYEDWRRSGDGRSRLSP